jgi:hypothetical protein
MVAGVNRHSGSRSVGVSLLQLSIGRNRRVGRLVKRRSTLIQRSARQRRDPGLEHQVFGGVDDCSPSHGQGQIVPIHVALTLSASREGPSSDAPFRPREVVDLNV